MGKKRGRKGTTQKRLKKLFYTTLTVFLEGCSKNSKLSNRNSNNSSNSSSNSSNIDK